MNEPGIADAQDVRLLRYPPMWESADVTATVPPTAPQSMTCGANIQLQGNQIAVYVDDPRTLVIV